jgi:hypothetical protein
LSLTDGPHVERGAEGRPGGDQAQVRQGHIQPLVVAIAAVTAGPDEDVAAVLGLNEWIR